MACDVGIIMTSLRLYPVCILHICLASCPPSIVGISDWYRTAYDCESSLKLALLAPTKEVLVDEHLPRRFQRGPRTFGQVRR